MVLAKSMLWRKNFVKIETIEERIRKEPKIGKIIAFKKLIPSSEKSLHLLRKRKNNNLNIGFYLRQIEKGKIIAFEKLIGKCKIFNFRNKKVIFIFAS